MQNLLNTALSILPKTTALWYRFDKLVVDDRGKEKAQYKEPLKIIGSFQAVDVQTIQELGLEIKREYKTFYTSNNLKLVNQSTSPDYLEISGSVYDIINSTNWHDINGWSGFLCIKRT